MHSQKVRLFVLAALLLCGALVPLNAQKVEVQYDKAAAFKQYKRYAWGKNSLTTRQPADMEAAIERNIEASAERELNAKGFVKDAEHPDFLIQYNGGGMPDPKAAESVASFAIPGGGGVGRVDIYGASLTVWMQVLAAIRFEIVDNGNKSTVWTSLTTKTIKDTKKFANNLQKEIDGITKKGLEKFPPK